jgi:protoheme IX farnesyltransferase
MAESAVAAPSAPARATWRDYKELTKPGVVYLMILTSVIGMCMAVPGWVPMLPLVLGNLGIALCAASAAAVNHVVDQRIDQRMARTRNRPLAGVASVTAAPSCLPPRSAWRAWRSC